MRGKPDAFFGDVQLVGHDDEARFRRGLRQVGVEGLEVTSHPSVRRLLHGATVVDEPRVVIAQGAGGGAVVTSQGPGTALEFALELVRLWVGDECADELERAMLV